MKDLGQLNYFLGMEFSYDGAAITILQKEYVMKILQKFSMLNCKPKPID